MPAIDVVKAWKDEAYRDTLTSEQRAQLPQHPSGVIEFGEPQLQDETLFGPAALHCKVLTNKTSNKNCLTTGGQCK